MNVLMTPRYVTYPPSASLAIGLISGGNDYDRGRADAAFEKAAGVELIVRYSRAFESPLCAHAEA